jgi:glucose uptake protein
MILPATTLASLLLLLLTLFCWGSWANTQKLVYKWRFELFYYDFAVGVALCMLIAVYTFGSANPQELTVSDNMMIAGYRKIAYSMATGLVINLANIMLVAAISVSGLAVSFPIAFGVGLIVMSLTNFIGNPASNNSALLFSGLVLILGAVLAEIFAYRSYLDALANKSKGVPVLDKGTRMPVRPKTGVAIVLSVVSGVAWGFFFPMIDLSRSGENGVGPYGIAGLIGVGMFFSTLLYVPFFVNFPVQGEPVRGRVYFQGTKKQHFWGIFGGIIWSVGLTAALVEAAAPPPVRTAPALAAGLVCGAPILGVLWGLLAWREFKDSPQSVKLLQFGMIVLFLAGLALVGLAPVYAAK